MEAAIDALTRGGQDLARYSDYARIRLDLIAASTELRERSLIKMASLAAAIARTLTAQRQEPSRTAAFAAQAAVVVFTAAYDNWADDTSVDLTVLMKRSLDDLRPAVGSPAAYEGLSSVTANHRGR